MRAQHAARLWVVGGLLVAVALVAGGWLMLIGPQHATTQSLEGQAADAQLQATIQRQRLAQLREEQGNLPRYQAELARDREALPAASGVPAFLRQLQAAGEATNVTVSGIVVDRPAQATGAQTAVYELPVGLTVNGSAPGVENFLEQLQRVQPRAALVSGVTAEATDPTESFARGVTARVSLRIFVAPAIGGE